MDHLFTWKFTMFLCNIAETAFMLLIHAAFLNSKSHTRSCWLIKACLISLIGYFVFTSIPMPPYIQNILAVGLCFIYTFFFSGSLLVRLLSTFFASSYMMLLNSLLISIEAYMSHTSSANIFNSAPLTLMNESIILFFGWIFWKFFHHRKRTQKLSFIQGVIALSYPLIATISEFLIARILQSTYNFLLLCLSIFLFISLLLHFVLIEMLNIQNQRNLQLSLIEQCSISEREKAEALLDAYTAQRKLTHEFTNHIEAIKSYLHLGEYIQAENYIDQLSANSIKRSLIINTHNPLADAILSQKYSLASQNGIRTLFHLCDLSSQPMENPDLVVVLSNLFNNAIEGSADVPNGEIHVKLQNTEKEFLISFRNSVAKDIPIHNNQPPISTKKNFGHGMGLLNVIEISKKYHGNYSISCRDHWFQTTVLINKGSSCR